MAKKESNSIINYSSIIEKKVGSGFRNQNAVSFKHPCNAIICGFTGSGKTNFLLNLLLTPELKMTYDRVYLICPSLDEPAYQFISTYYRDIKEKTEKELSAKTKKQVKLDDVFHYYSKPEDIPAPESFDKSLQNIVIVDDFVTDKKVNEIVAKLSIKNRKVNTSLIYLSQSYFEIPKILRRQLGNGYVVLYGTPSAKECVQYAQEFSLGIDSKQFKQLFKTATKTKYTPLIIDFKTTDPHWKFRAGLTVPIGPVEEEKDPELATDFYGL